MIWVIHRKLFQIYHQSGGCRRHLWPSFDLVTDGRFRSRWPGELLTTIPTFMIKECWFRIPVAGIFFDIKYQTTILKTSKPIVISNIRYQCHSRIWIDLLGVRGRNFGRGEIWVATLIRVEVASVKDTREEPRHSCLGHSPIPSPLSLPDLGGLLEPAVVVVVVVEITREEPAFLRWSLSSLSIYQPLPKTTCHPRVWREIRSVPTDEIQW